MYIYIYNLRISPWLGRSGLARRSLRRCERRPGLDGPGLVWSHGKTTGSPLKALKDVEKAMGFRVKMAGRRQESPGTC